MRRWFSIIAICFPLFLSANPPTDENFGDELRKLYPNLSAPAFKRKLASIETEYDFYRAFVPYFYLAAREQKSKIPVLSDLKNCRGWCVGDPHVENWAILSPNADHAILSLDDGDDSGPSFLSLDLLRMMVSAKLLDGRVKLSDILEAYLNGLNDREHKNSKVIRRLIERVEAEGLSPRHRDLAADGIHLKRPNAIDAHRDSIELTAGERNEIAKIVSKLFDANFIDGFRYIRYFGGSGGLTRYRVVLNVKGQKDLVIVEFKELADPAIKFFDPSAEIPGVFERAEVALRRLQGSKSPHFYGLARIADHPVLIKPRWESNETLEQASFTKAEFREIVFDIAYRLGEIHRRSVDDLGDYKRFLADLKPSSWRSSVRNCSQIIRLAFNKIQSK